MSEKIPQALEGVSETLLIPLNTRARETSRPDALIKDDQALRMVNQIDYDFTRLTMHRHDEVAIIVRMARFDAFVRDFLRRNPDGLVVHIGCGLDTRFERVDNGRVQWFDLDLPPVMDLRAKLLRHDDPRYHALSVSVFDDSWQEQVARCGPRPKMFIAEGVFVYFYESEIKTLFLKLRDCFPGAELVCDAQTPFIIWADNLHLAITGVSARLHWQLRNPKDVESWGEGFRLLEEFYYYEDDEPGMKPYRWIRYIPGMARSAGIFRYQLGS